MRNPPTSFQLSWSLAWATDTELKMAAAAKAIAVFVNMILSSKLSFEAVRCGLIENGGAAALVPGASDLTKMYSPRTGQRGIR